MATPKVLRYHAFADLPDPEAVRLWQHTLCDSLGLRGRIIIAPHGINGTLGGDVIELKKYVTATKAYGPFRGIDFTWSEGRALDDGSTADFPRLSVRVRDELVTFGAPDEVQLDGHEVVDGGTHLSPEQLHDLVASKDVVFFADLLDSGVYDHLKDRPVITYCTGGIRCEILTPLMRRRGFTEVYQRDGGIATYGEAFGDDGLWEGSLYVFDDRLTTDFSDHAAVVGRCGPCAASKPACPHHFS